MKINYDTDKLEKIVKDFANITGLSIAVIDLDFNYVITTIPDNEAHEYCKILQKYPEGKRKCVECDKLLLSECSKKKEFVSKICHAGICDSVMPVIKDDIMLGYIMLGRMRKEKDYSNVINKISWCEEKNNLEKHFLNVSYYDEAKVKSAAGIAVMLVSYILLADMIKLEKNETGEKVAAYIEENIQKDLTIPTLCRLFNISKNKLYECFRKSNNMSVNRYISKIRVEKAVALLKKTDLPVYEISEKVGIDNYTYFCRMIKRITGKTPLEIRKYDKN